MPQTTPFTVQTEELKQLPDVNLLDTIEDDIFYTIIYVNPKFRRETPVLNSRGRDFKRKFNAEYWDDVISSGNPVFIPGERYKVYSTINGNGRATLVWEQDAASFKYDEEGNEIFNRLNDQMQMQNPPMQMQSGMPSFLPYPMQMQNSFDPTKQNRVLADAISQQTDAAIESLQSELDRKYQLIRDLQAQLVEYQNKLENQNKEHWNEKQALYVEINSLKVENAEIKRDLENEKFRNEMRGKLESDRQSWLSERQKEEKRLYEKERALESNNEVGMKDLMGLAQMFMMKQAGAPAATTMAGVPRANGVNKTPAPPPEYQQQKYSNIDYAEVDYDE